MGRHSRLFTEFARNQGLGVAAIGRMEDTWRRMLSDPLKTASELYGSGVYKNKRGDKCRFELGYIKHNRKRGAVSARRGDRLCAGVFTTTPAQFWECVSCTFLHPDVYPEFGDPSRSVDQLRELDPTTIPGFYLEYFQDSKVHKAFLAEIVNKCPIRDWVIRKIVSYMLDFYWLHETAHLQYGHSDLWADRFGHDTLDEEIEPRVQTERRTRILMERQADASALVPYLSKEYASLIAPEWSHVGVLELRILALFFICTIWIWEEFREAAPGEFEKNVSGDYPHSVERYDNIVRNLEFFSFDKKKRDLRAKRALAELQLRAEIPEPGDRYFDSALFQTSLNAAWKRLESMSKAVPAFEALEHFRISMKNEIEESRRQIRPDDLLKDVFENYLYS